MKKYHSRHIPIWDGWFVNDNGRLHMFHLQDPRPDCPIPFEESRSVGHAVSDDGLHWEQQKSVLPPLGDDSLPLDYHFKFTGCAVKKDDVCYLFYTMRDKELASQRIGVSTSTDMVNWDIYPGNPVIVPDDRILLGYEKLPHIEWQIVDCRDPIVVWDEKTEKYYAYFATATDVGREHPIGVVAMAESTDLLHWGNQQIVYTPRQNGMIEVPDVFEMDGKWYLTFLTGPHYAGRSLTDDDYVCNCTLYATADSPRGPFVEEPNNILIGGKSNSGFTCRSVLKDGVRYLYYVDRTANGTSLSLPKELRRNSDGALRACYTPLLEKLRIREIPLPEELERIPNSFAWHTYGGKWLKTADGFRMTTTEWDYQIAVTPVEAPSLELRAAVTVDAVGGGLYITDGDKRYVLSVEPDKNRLLVAAPHDFTYVMARQYPFRRHQTYDLRVIVMDGNIEIYVQDELLVQGGLEIGTVTQWGIFCDRGTTMVENIAVFELE